MHRKRDLLAIRRDRDIPVPAGRDGGHVVVDRRDVLGALAGETDQKEVLALPGPPLVPVPPEEVGPDPRLRGVIAAAPVDLLVGGPLDVARHDQALAVRQPHRIGHAVRQIAQPPRFASARPDWQDPELRAVLGRAGRDEREGLTVRRPARRAVGPGPLRERAGLTGPQVGEPDAGRPSVVLERILGDAVRDPLAVRRERGVADGFHRDVVVEPDGALLTKQTGKREKGNGKRERQHHHESLHRRRPLGTVARLRLCAPAPLCLCASVPLCL